MPREYIYQEEDKITRFTFVLENKIRDSIPTAPDIGEGTGCITRIGNSYTLWMNVAGVIIKFPGIVSQ